MAEKEKKKHVLFTQTGKAVARDELQSAIEEQLRAAPEEEAALTFTIRPLAATEEFASVIDKLARAGDTNFCNGSKGLSRLGSSIE